MKNLPLKLDNRLQKRKEDDSFRKLLPITKGVDFFSNDYLGFSNSEFITQRVNKLMSDNNAINGATGSRLLSGNHPVFKKLEDQLSVFHNSPAALIFNSGYDANLGFFSAVPQKNDIIFYDEYSHASIRDGLKMSLAKSYKFRHNDLQDLQEKLSRLSLNNDDSEIYLVTESVFSMDGDSPDLLQLLQLSEKYNANLVVDEAHATGVVGNKGQGLVQELEIEHRVFARIHTFGKAMGCHGAVILGSKGLKDYLVNFSRSLIYTTALPPHTVNTILAAYSYLETDQTQLKKLKENIRHFKIEVENNDLKEVFVESDSAIQVCIIKGNSKVKSAAEKLQKNGFNVKPILSPTVPKGSERLRFCVHSYNYPHEISEVLKVLGNFAAKNR
ncbi:pyridoxal phosphate-dependent aminotransferase family protein [Gramella lutea]|uniref:Pyridoxal phosphate-dependent aminotransferase family protein n=1 Tax=Christiangramia lutea TaxID=1607951 RepID=A0A9X2A9I6_9FLAO|nr:pyridoxal phosphate-dependent aminotransferase family protein [Christiangramia lutea]MCH4822176.1 pyridoxal phosphate-dependent aminotransferase family protein [Christiangramia lutea]